MTLQLEIVSDHADLVGDDAIREFRESGGTIGRSLQNDWILPDPDRYISGRHATIDYKGGIYYLLDTSSNGVYINGDCEPLGKGNSRRLFNGDRLRLGDFEIVVSVDAGESIVMPLDDTDVNRSVDEASLVDEDPLKTGMLLLDENEITGDDEFQSALFGSPVDTGVAKRAELKAAGVETDPPSEPSPAEHPTAADADSDLVTRELLDAFARGLGISRDDLPPTADVAEVLLNAGEVLREFVEGSTRMLASRANLKGTFRLDQTTVLPRHNNPLKLSTNTKDLLLQLLVGKEGEYLGPRDAVREVNRDLLFHQDAFLDAMTSAFTEFADRFDPDELEQDFAQSIGSNPMAKFFAAKKYWPMYRDLYPIMTEKGGSGRFPQMFAEEFVKAYERQIAEYKRVGTEELKATVILDKKQLTPEPADVIDPVDDFAPASDSISMADDDATVLPEVTASIRVESSNDSAYGDDFIDLADLEDLEDLVLNDPADRANG